MVLQYIARKKKGCAVPFCLKGRKNWMIITRWAWSNCQWGGIWWFFLKVLELSKVVHLHIIFFCSLFRWGILFSHPRDFTPVCTTELARAAKLHDEFKKRDVKMIALSIDSVEDHRKWSEVCRYYTYILQNKYWTPDTFICKSNFFLVY